jgi:ABC-type uncharacterized transport system substrate-binding protein
MWRELMIPSREQFTRRLAAIPRPGGRAMRRCVAALLLAMLAGHKPAESARVLVLLGKSHPQYVEVAHAFGEEWKSATGVEPQAIPFPKDDAERRQLLRPRPALIVGLGEAPTVWALGREEDFPLGFSMVVAPERLDGLAKMLSTKKRAMCGVSIEIPEERQLDVVQKLMPQLKRIGMISTAVAMRDSVARMRSVCERRSIELIHVELASLAELPAKLTDLLGQVDLLWSLPDPEVFQPPLAQHIISECAQKNVALLGLSATFVRAGATLSFDPDYREVGKLLAQQCSRAKANPRHDVPVEHPKRIVLSINVRSFESLNLVSEFEMANVVVSKY